MKAWAREHSKEYKRLVKARRKMRRLIVRKKLAHKVLPKKRAKMPAGEEPPPTPRILSGSAWEAEMWEHINLEGGDTDWWLANVDKVPNLQLVAALRRRGVEASEGSRRWLLVDKIRRWATHYLPPEERAVRDSELTWLREVEEIGGVYSCGMGSKGQLGHGDLNGRVLPTAIARLSGRGIFKVEAGFDSYRAVAVSTSGFAYAWGGGEEALLGTEVPIAFTDIKLAQIKQEMVDDESLSDIDIDLGYETEHSSDQSLFGSGSDYDVMKAAPPVESRAPTLWDPQKYEAEQAKLRAGKIGKKGEDLSYADRKPKVPFRARPWQKRAFNIRKLWGSGWAAEYTRPMPLCMQAFRGEPPTAKPASADDLAKAFRSGSEAGALKTLAKPPIDDDGHRSVYQLGHSLQSYKTYTFSPAPVDPVFDVSIGKGHVLLTTRSGKLFCWGENNESGQIGLAQIHGERRVRYPPVPTPAPNSTLTCHPVTKRIIRSVSAGSGHSGVVTDTGVAYTFGSSVRGRLGLGMESVTRQGVGDGRGMVYPAPTSLGIGVLAGHIVTQVACGSMHTLCIADGKVYAFGDGYGGRLGDGSTISRAVVHPTIVEGLKDKFAFQVAAGMWHSFALVFREGVDAYEAPELPPETASVGTHLSDDHTVASSAYLPPWKQHLMYFPRSGAGKVYVWGTGTDGQLGIGEPVETPVPVKVPYLPRNVSYVTCSQFHSAAVTSTGSLYTWGRGTGGSLARELPGGVYNDRLPDRVRMRDSIGRKLKVVDVACGRNFTVIATASRAAVAVMKQFRPPTMIGPGPTLSTLEPSQSQLWPFGPSWSIDDPANQLPGRALDAMRDVSHLFTHSTIVPTLRAGDLFPTTRSMVEYMHRGGMNVDPEEEPEGLSLCFASAATEGKLSPDRGVREGIRDVSVPLLRTTSRGGPAPPSQLAVSPMPSSWSSFPGDAFAGAGGASFGSPPLGSLDGDETYGQGDGFSDTTSDDFPTSDEEFERGSWSSGSDNEGLDGLSPEDQYFHALADAAASDSHDASMFTNHDSAASSKLPSEIGLDDEGRRQLIGKPGRRVSQEELALAIRRHSSAFTSDSTRLEVAGFARASQDIWSLLDGDETDIFTSVEARVDKLRSEQWYQKIGVNPVIVKEARMQTLSQHTLHPKCASCVKCPGFTISADSVVLCSCGHRRIDHQPQIGLRQTLQKMLENMLYELNCGWLYANKTESMAAGYSTHMTRLVRGFLTRIKVYRLLCKKYRKKFHPIAEEFYYEIVTGWARGTGSWKKPCQLKYLPPPRNDLAARTPELRRAQEVVRRKAEHEHIAKAIEIAERAVVKRVRKEVRVMQQPPKSQVYYQVEDLMDAAKRMLDETIPERKWAAMGKIMFEFFDLNADGHFDEEDLANAFSHLDITADTQEVEASFEALGFLRRDMFALRLPATLQQTYCGFNVPVHKQPRAKKGLESDQLYRQVFAAVPGAVNEPPNLSRFKIIEAMKRIGRALVCSSGVSEPPPSNVAGRDAMYWQLPCPPQVDLLSFLAWIAPRPPMPSSMRRRVRFARFRLRMQRRYNWYRKRPGRTPAHIKLQKCLGNEFRAEEYVWGSASRGGVASFRLPPGVDPSVALSGGAGVGVGAGAGAVEPFSCGSCGEAVRLEAENVLVLGCTHVFHRACIKESLGKQLGDNEVYGSRLGCPSCDSSLGEQEISAVVGTESYRGSQQRVEASDAAEATAVVAAEGAQRDAHRQPAMFECPVCQDATPVDEGVTLTCDHRLCKDCISQYMTLKISEKAVEPTTLVCPMPDCKQSLTPQEVEGNVTPDVLTKYLAFAVEVSLEKDPNHVRCPKCGLITLFPPKEESPETWRKAKCPNHNCGAKFCAECKDKQHDGGCEEYREWKRANGLGDVAFEKMMKDLNWSRCPSCRMPVELESGCFFMTCKAPVRA